MDSNIQHNSDSNRGSEDNISHTEVIDTNETMFRAIMNSLESITARLDVLERSNITSDIPIDVRTPVDNKKKSKGDISGMKTWLRDNNNYDKEVQLNSDKHIIVEDEQVKDETPLSKHRRRTMTEFKHVYDNPVNNVHRQLSQPSFEHLRLRDTQADHVLAFLRGISIYITTTKFPINIQSRIDRDVQLTVMHKNMLSKEDFMSAEYPDIVKYLTDIVKPLTRSEFAVKFEQCLKIEKKVIWSTRYATDLIKYTGAILTYIDEARYVFGVLADDNYTNIPPCTLKKFGLMSSFKKGLRDSYYFDHTMIQIDNKEFNRFGDFLNAFEKQVMKHRELHEHTYTIPYRNVKEEKTTIDSDDEDNDKPRHRHRHRGNMGSMRKDDKRHVHNMTTYSSKSNTLTYSSEETSNTSSNGSSTDDSNRAQHGVWKWHETVEDTANTCTKDSNSNMQHSEDDASITADMLHAMELNKKRVLPCFKLLNHGECSYGKTCKYSHDPKVIEEAKREAKNMPRQSNIGKSPQVKILHRDNKRYNP